MRVNPRGVAGDILTRFGCFSRVQLSCIPQRPSLSSMYICKRRGILLHSLAIYSGLMELYQSYQHDRLLTYAGRVLSAIWSARRI
jgi:hypothetical protein